MARFSPGSRSTALFHWDTASRREMKLSVACGARAPDQHFFGRWPLSRRVSGRRPLSRRVLPGAAARGRCRQGYKRCAIDGLVHVGIAIEQHPHESLVALLHADNRWRCTAVHGLVHVSTATSLVFKPHVWADCFLLLALLLTPQRQRACAEWNHEKTSEHSGPWPCGNGSNWCRSEKKAQLLGFEPPPLSEKGMR